MRASHPDLLDSELTCRDLVLAALLSLRFSKAGDRHRISVIAKVLSAVVAVASHQAMDCYGIPDWLIDGLGELLTYPDSVPENPKTTENDWVLLRQLLADEVSIEGVAELHERLGKAMAPPSGDFRRLREGTLVIVDGTMAERPLAAASGTVQFKDVERLAQEAVKRGRRRIDQELGWRLQRIDVPIVCPVSERGKRSGMEGLLIGAQVVFYSHRIPKVDVSLPPDDKVRQCFNKELLDGWQPSEQSFKQGMEQGLEAALALLAELGVGDEDRKSVSEVRVFLRGILPPAQVSDGSAGLPLALHVLAKISELPPPGIAASGTFISSPDGTYTLEGMTAEVAEAKLKAVLCDGLKEGLMVYSPDSPTMPGMILLERPTLAVAARQLWGKQWDEWTDRTKSRALSQLRLHQGWAGGRRSGASFYNDQPMIVPTGRGEEVSRIFTGHPTVAFVGGLRQSGKTWIAQDVEDRMREKGDWQTLVFTVEDGRIPSKEDILKALSLFPLSPSKLLLILDGLEWSAQAENLEGELNDVCSAHQVSILACIRSDENTEWPEIKQHRTSIVGQDMVRDFAEALLKTYPHLSAARPVLGTILRGAAGDLWWGVRLIQTAATARPNSSYEELLAVFAGDAAAQPRVLRGPAATGGAVVVRKASAGMVLGPEEPSSAGHSPSRIEDVLRQQVPVRRRRRLDPPQPRRMRSDSHGWRFSSRRDPFRNRAYSPPPPEIRRNCHCKRGRGFHPPVGAVWTVQRKTFSSTSSSSPMNRSTAGLSTIHHLDSLTRLLAATSEAIDAFEVFRGNWAERLARLVTIELRTLHPRQLCDALNVLRRHSS